MAKKFTWLGLESEDDSADLDATTVIADSDSIDDKNWTADGRTIKVLSDLCATRKSDMKMEDAANYELEILAALNNVESPLDRLAIVVALSTSVFPIVRVPAGKIIDSLADKPQAQVSSILAGYTTGAGRYANLHTFFATTKCMPDNGDYTMPDALKDTIDTINTDSKNYAVVAQIYDTLGDVNEDSSRPYPYYEFDSAIAAQAMMIGASQCGVVSKDENDPFAKRLRESMAPLTSEQRKAVVSYVNEILTNFDDVNIFDELPVGTEDYDGVPNDSRISATLAAAIEKYMFAYSQGDYTQAVETISALVSGYDANTSQEDIAITLLLCNASGIGSLENRIYREVMGRCYGFEESDFYSSPANAYMREAWNDSKECTPSWYNGSVTPVFNFVGDASLLALVRLNINDTADITEHAISALKELGSDKPWRYNGIAQIVIKVFTAYEIYVRTDRVIDIHKLASGFDAQSWIEAIKFLKANVPDISRIGIESNGAVISLLSTFIAQQYKVGNESLEEPKKEDKIDEEDIEDEDAATDAEDGDLDASTEDEETAGSDDTALDGDDDLDQTNTKLEAAGSLSDDIDGDGGEESSEEEADGPGTQNGDSYEDMPVLPELVQGGAVDSDMAAPDSGALFDEDRPVNGETVENDDVERPNSDYVIDAPEDKVKAEVKEHLDANSNGSEFAEDNEVNDGDILNSDNTFTEGATAPDTTETIRTGVIDPKEELDSTIDKFMDDFKSEESVESELESTDGDSESGLDSEIDPDSESDDMSDDDFTSEDTDSETDGTEDASDDINNDDDYSFGANGDFSDEDDSDSDDLGGDDNSEVADSDTVAEDGYEASSEFDSDSNEVENAGEVTSDALVKLKAIEALKQIATESTDLSPVAKQLINSTAASLASAYDVDSDDTYGVLASAHDLLTDDVIEGSRYTVESLMALLDNAPSVAGRLYSAIDRVLRKVKAYDIEMYELRVPANSAIPNLEDGVVEFTSVALDAYKLYQSNTIEAVNKLLSGNVIGDEYYMNNTMFNVSPGGTVSFTYANSDEMVVALTKADVIKLLVAGGLFARAVRDNGTQHLRELLETKQRELTRLSNGTYAADVRDEFTNELVSTVNAIQGVIATYIKAAVEISTLPTRMAKVSEE